MTKNKFVLYALNSFPLHPQLPPLHPRVRDLLQFITYGGGWGSEDLGVSCGFQGGRKGRDKLSLTQCKGGDRRNLTAGERGGFQNITEPGKGGGETDKFKLNFSDRLSSQVITNGL